MCLRLRNRLLITRFPVAIRVVNRRKIGRNLGGYVLRSNCLSAGSTNRGEPVCRDAVISTDSTTHWPAVSRHRRVVPYKGGVDWAKPSDSSSGASSFGTRTTRQAGL